jgi:DNA polymerase-3 subunit delta
MQIKPYQADSFINNIAQNKDIFAAVVYGPESGLISIRSKKIATSIVENLSDQFLVANVSEKKVEEDKGILASEFSSITMFGGRKLIWVTGGNKITESLKLVFDGGKNKDFSPLGDNFILISARDLDKSSSLRKFAEQSLHIASIACYEDDAATISAIIRQKFKEGNFTIENGVIEAFLNKFGKNRQIILNEIDKLIIFMGDNKHISMDILEQNIADIAEISAFELVKSFADLDLKKSMIFVEKLFAEKASSVMITRLLSSYFMKLALVKSNIEDGSNLELEFKIQNIFFKQQPSFRNHLNIWSTKAIGDILRRLQDLEIKCKSSNTNDELMVSGFINFVLNKLSSNRNRQTARKA